MNKTNMLAQLSIHLGLPKYRCREIVDVWCKVVADELCQGNSVNLQGFGSLQPWEQTFRVGRNPRTGVACPIHPRTSVKFRPGKLLLQRINASDTNNSGGI